MAGKTKTIKLEDFKGFKSNIDVNVGEIIAKNVEEATDTLKSFNNWEFRRNNKQYSEGWSFIVENIGKPNVIGTVFNKTDWQLTWLLENGHLIVNKKGGIGWASPRKHIEPTYDKQSKKYIRDMKNIDDLIDFE